MISPIKQLIKRREGRKDGKGKKAPGRASGRRPASEQRTNLSPGTSVFLAPGTGDLIHEQMSSFMYPVVWSHELPNVVAAIVPSHATSS